MQKINEYISYNKEISPDITTFHIVWINQPQDYKKCDTLYTNYLSNPKFTELVKYSDELMKNINENALIDANIKNQKTLMRNLPAILKKAKQPADIIKLASKFKVSPHILAKKVKSAELAKDINTVLSQYSLASLSPVLTAFAPSQRPIENKTLADPYAPENIKDSARRAKLNEDLFVAFFQSLGISLFTQEDQIILQTMEFGRAVSTPDILFKDIVYINSQRIYWIDFKNYFGFNKFTIFKHIPAQTRKYTTKYGPGAVCFRYGFAEGTTIDTCMILDGNVLGVMLKYV